MKFLNLLCWLFVFSNCDAQESKLLINQKEISDWSEYPIYPRLMDQNKGEWVNEFKYLDDINIKMVSAHCNIKEDFEKKAAQAAEIGMEYLICPWVGPQKSMDDWKKVTDEFNACGEICKKNGIKFAYHNHAYTFKAFSGMIPHDFVMENTDPALVDHEMDIYWVVTGGADPIEFLNKYPNRFRLCHIKDRMKTAPADERMASCDLGTGKIDFPKILKVAKEKGMKYFILEQERYDNSTPLKSVEVGAKYLKEFKFA